MSNHTQKPEYVKNLEEHHVNISFKEEYIELLKENGVEFDEKYLGRMFFKPRWGFFPHWHTGLFKLNPVGIF